MRQTVQAFGAVLQNAAPSKATHTQHRHKTGARQSVLQCLQKAIPSSLPLLKSQHISVTPTNRFPADERHRTREIGPLADAVYEVLAADSENLRGHC
jgi:hypothetical protein